MAGGRLPPPGKDHSDPQESAASRASEKAALEKARDSTHKAVSRTPHTLFHLKHVKSLVEQHLVYTSQFLSQRLKCPLVSNSTDNSEGRALPAGEKRRHAPATQSQQDTVGHGEGCVS